MSMENAISRVKREAGIKRCIIVEGNVNDVVLYNRKVMTVRSCLKEVLDGCGFNGVISWDRITGIEGDVDTVKLADEVPDDGNEAYDLGEDADSVPQTQAAGACKELGDIFALVNRTFADPGRRTAFILDWSDYLFSTGNQLDPDDRQFLTLLGKALRDTAPKYTGDTRRSTVVMIVSKAGSLPLNLYSGNPEVSIVTLSKPDMEERRKMLTKISAGFELKDVKGEICDSPRFEDYVDMLNDFTNREIIQLANMSRSEKDLTFEKLYYLFRYGEKENPWEKLDPDKVRKIGKILGQRVIGQDRAIKKVEDTIIKAFMGITGMHKSSSRTMPKGVFFFVGPTGVGKTELSKALAKFLFGDESACIRFDMSEYTQPNSDQKLIGAPPGYVGYEAGGQLTNAIREKPFSVVLFDEIEKAAKPNPRILDIFLQILEDGRLTDGRGETTYFSDTVIIFTSNLGASEVVNTGDDEQTAEEFIRIVREYFDNELKRPEILGRIGYDNIVPFNFINDPAFAVNILKSKLGPLEQGIKEKYGIELKIRGEEAFYSYVLEGADTAKGGRDILNALDTRLLSPLAKFLFDNYDDLDRFRGEAVSARVRDGSLEFSIDD